MIWSAIVLFLVVFPSYGKFMTLKLEKNQRCVAIWNPTRVGKSLEKELILALMTKLQQVSNKLWKWNVQESFCVNSVCSLDLSCIFFLYPDRSMLTFEMGKKKSQIRESVLQFCSLHACLQCTSLYTSYWIFSKSYAPFSICLH